MGSRAGTPLESSCHCKQVSDRYLSLQVVVRAGGVLGKKVQDSLVNSLDKPLIYGNADQGGDKALGHRSNQMFVALTTSAKIPLKDKIATSHNEKGADAAIARLDFSFKVRQGLCAHPH